MDAFSDKQRIKLTALVFVIASYLMGNYELSATSFNETFHANNENCVTGYLASAPFNLTLSGGLILGAQTICYNTDANVISNRQPASGGSGNYSYLWQQSIDGTTWNSIACYSLSYDPGILTISRYYRRKAFDLDFSETAYSNSIFVTVRPPLSGGSITGDETICVNNDAGIISNVSSASGGGGVITYFWQKSEYDFLSDAWTVWVDIDASSVSYDPGILTQTTRYRRVALESVCTDTAYTTPIIKTVGINGGSITGDQVIYFNKHPYNFLNSESASGGLGTIVYQWQQSADNGTNWSDISGATSASYLNPPQLLQSTLYRRYAVDNGGCGTALSNVISIAVVTHANTDKSRNYILSVDLLTEQSDSSEIRYMSVDSMRQEITYYDGLGRPMQNIIVYSSPSYNDLITPFYFDQFNREALKYLPYNSLSTNHGQYDTISFLNQISYYDSLYPLETAFAKTIYDNSPLNRVYRKGSSGTEWQPDRHPARYDYGTNTQSDVRLWKVDSCNNITTSGYYTSGSLFKTVIKDENWDDQATGDSLLLHTYEEYKDYHGNVVLKRTYVIDSSLVTSAETYYIFDDLSLLRYVLPPEAVKRLGSTSVLTSDSTLVKNWCYYYQYDNNKRMIVKQLPGADPVYLVYDSRDRLVATQDGNMRENSVWLFTKYDTLNRPVLTGILTTSTPVTIAQMQAAVDSAYTGSTPRDLSVTRDGQDTTHQGYTNTSFPNTTDGTILYHTVNYYDDYDYPWKKDFNNSADVSGYHDSSGDTNYFDCTRGLITGSRTLVLDGGDNKYLTSTTYYDNKYRPIQMLKDLYDSIDGGEEIISNRYNFNGQVLETRLSQTFNSVTTEVSKYYSYDHMRRLKKSEHQIGSISSGKVILSQTIYNELGQQKQKKLHADASSALQTVDYGYNIRGWVTEINQPDTLGDDLFALTLLYNDTTGLSPLACAPQYNGNISGIKWKSGQGSDTLKIFGFAYDELDRLRTSDYVEIIDSVLLHRGRYNESVAKYDLQGNIMKLYRSGMEDTSYIPDLDALDYIYEGNRLIAVEDAGNKTFGFVDGNDYYSSNEPDYYYDSNGSMVRDLNKDIDTIIYNFLNLPSKVIKDTSNKVVYVHDAIGTKLKKISTVGGITTNRYYAGVFEYDNDGALKLIHTDEGVVNVADTVYVYEYFLKDHLGNTRVTFKPSGSSSTLLQAVDYYPFGMISWYSGSSNNEYLYNGKELQDESLGGVKLDWYDYGARFYDPQIGRFPSLDPLSDKFVNLSPYNYASNNPVTNIDLWGLQGIGINLLPDFIALVAKYKSITSEAIAPTQRLFTGQTVLSEIPAEVTQQMSPQTTGMINTMSKLNDANQVLETTGNLGKEVVNDIGKAAETTGDAITTTGYVAAPFTAGASLALVPIGESISTVGKGTQATVCVMNKDYEGAADLGVQMGTSFVTNSLVNTAVNQTIKVAAGNITEKEILTQKGVLGFVGKLWEKTVDLINR